MVGWPGTTNIPEALGSLRSESRRAGYRVRPVSLSTREREQFYNGFSNEVVWPLFHDLQTFCNFQESYFRAYLDVNRKFGRILLDEHRPDDYVWVHDYHLMGVGAALAEAGASVGPGFFLHIPFPPCDVFRKLPWRREVLDSLFDFAQIGFQTEGDLRNFLHCARRLRPDVTMVADVDHASLDVNGRRVHAAAFPIGIDARAVEVAARSPEVSARIAARDHQTQLLFGIDRLDYTKGIPHKFRGFRRLLEKHPEMRGRVSLVQVVSPSRETIPRYNDLKDEIETLVGRINGELTEPGWTPIQYIYRKVDLAQLLAWYQVADAVVVTSLRDGMNLVAKEYCAASVESQGALVLSEFAGVADEVGPHALLVNPYSIDEVATAMHRALVMPPEERRRRMTAMRTLVREHDIYWWVDRFLKAASDESRDLPSRRPPRSRLGRPRRHAQDVVLPLRTAP